MATKKAASKKGTKKGRTTKKGGASNKGGATKKAGAKKSTAKKTGAKAPVSPGKCTGWQAVQDNEPPPPSRLRVTGRCTFPTHGYKVTLREAVPQGINFRILLLNKIVTPPKGPVIQTPQTVPVSFTKKTNTKYTHVTILPEVTTFRVKQVS
jgi:hypothetical protein